MTTEQVLFAARESQILSCGGDTKAAFQNASRRQRLVTRHATPGVDQEIAAIQYLGAFRHAAGWDLLACIRKEIHPKVIALRERQEVLESIGTRVNGGF